MPSSRPGNPNRLVHDVLVAWGSHPRLCLWRSNTGAGYPPGSSRLVTFGLPGTPDVIGILGPGGLWVGIECKTGSGRLSAEQKVFCDVLTSLGGLFVLAHSVEDVDRAFAEVGVTR